MSKNKIRWILTSGFLISIIGLCLLYYTVGREQEKGGTEDSYEIEIPAAELVSAEVFSTVITVPEKGKEDKDINISRKKINIYILDEKGKNTVPLSTFVGLEGYSPKTVADAVMLALGDRVNKAGINHAEEDGVSVRVDLGVKEPKYPFGKLSEKEEELILDCISYSILDNFSEYKKIYFSVNGEAYHSKNIKLSLDKPFINE